MNKNIVWLNKPKNSSTDVDGKSVELDIYEKTSGFRAKGIGRMRVQYHPKTSGLFCIWAAYGSPREEIEMALDDIDEDHLRAHPDAGTADYVCDAKYR